MKFFGKDVQVQDKGYFGVRRCTICKEELRDVNLVELYAVQRVCFLPLKSTLMKRILVCQHCNSYMEIDDKLWRYYDSYYNRRFNKPTTDDIIHTLTEMSHQMQRTLDMDSKIDQKSIDLIYKSLIKKYEVWENIEEIMSVFYK